MCLNYNLCLYRVLMCTKILFCIFLNAIFGRPNFMSECATFGSVDIINIDKNHTLQKFHDSKDLKKSALAKMANEFIWVDPKTNSKLVNVNYFERSGSFQLQFNSKNWTILFSDSFRIRVYLQSCLDLLNHWWQSSIHN